MKKKVRKRKRKKSEEDRLDDVGMAGEFLEDGDLADGSAGDAFVFVLETDLFDGDDLVVLGVAGLEDDAVRSLAELLEGLVFLEARRGGRRAGGGHCVCVCGVG